MLENKPFKNTERLQKEQPPRDAANLPSFGIKTVQ